MVVAAAVPPSLMPAILTSAACVDCGSGHTGVHFYTTSADGVQQRARAGLKHADGGNLPVTDSLTGTGDFAEFIDQLSQVLSRQHSADGVTPDILFVGATGGVRAALKDGKINESRLDAFRAALVRAFEGQMRVVKFEVVTGVQEAEWELEAAQAIWGQKASEMFPTTAALQGVVVPTTALGPVEQAAADSMSRAPTHADLPSLAIAPQSMGLFSGGGQSMQLGRSGSAPLSFPFSTFPPEMEERQGASPDAWLDDDIWGRWAERLAATVQQEATRHERFDGCYVGTAMNHRAAMFCEIAEVPLTAGAAAAALRAALPQFRGREGALYERMMATKLGGPNYPLARITAMHTYRLATVLEHMFAPEAKLFFARNGVDAAGQPIDCEWTVGAFVAEARSLVEAQ